MSIHVPTPRIQLPKKFGRIFEPHRYKAFYGGRGSAKSHTVASALVITAAMQRKRIVCGREIQKSIQESVKKLIEDKIEAYGLQNFFTSTKNSIVGRNGSEFLFMGLRTNIASVKSTEGIDIFWVEEAATVSQTSINVLVPTIRQPGSEIWFTWNPDKPTDPVDAMFRGEHGAPPDTLIERINWDDNPWFPEELRKEMEWDKKRDPEKYAFIWLGEYQRNSEARVFKNWKVESFETPIGARFYYGADFGFSVDPTTLVRCYFIGRTLFIDHEAYAVGCEIDRTPQLFDKVPDARKWPICADSARPETISYLQRHGYPKMFAAKKGADSVMDGIEFMKSYDIVIHPRCRHVIDEFTLYSWKIDKLTNQVLPVLEDKKNHTIDAARYAVEAVRRVLRTGAAQPLGGY